MTEGGAGPVRWTCKLDEWCTARQNLVITDRVSERQMFPAKFTVVVMEDFNSLDSNHGYRWKEEADGQYMELMKRLR
eukprot:8877804-Lingulodinium_polyedra.AAC.1